MRKQEKAITAVVGMDLLSTGIKFALAGLTGSLALLADAWHSIGDLATSLLVLSALILDRRGVRQDRRQDAAHEKPRIFRPSAWESRVCAVIGLLLVLVGAGVFEKVYTDPEPPDIRHPVMGSLLVLFLILLSYIRFRFEETAGDDTASPALVADACHSRADMYVLLLVLGSFLGELIEIRIDRWVALYIAAVIFALALKTLYRSLRAMFLVSSGTVPEARTLEDRFILRTLGPLRDARTRLLARFFGPGDSSAPGSWGRRVRPTVCACVLVLVVAWLLTGIYTVGPSEVAIVERFGRAVNLETPAGPGLHMTWPAPLGRVRTVDTQSVLSLRLGYQPRERPEVVLWTRTPAVKDYSVLSGDGAIIDLMGTLHFRVSDPAAFLYHHESPIDGLEMLSDQILRELIGSRDLFGLLTGERDSLEHYGREEIQALADRMNLGVRILSLCLLDMHPPTRVAPAFEDVVSAQEDLETYVEEARGYGKALLPSARAEAYEQGTRAQAYGRDLVTRATGKAAAFADRNVAFLRHEEVNRHRMRMEGLEGWIKGKTLLLIDPAASPSPMDLIINRSGAPDAAPTVLPPQTGGDSPHAP